MTSKGEHREREARPEEPLGRAGQNLEQVGVILRRLDLDRECILALRAETRAILADLAA